MTWFIDLYPQYTSTANWCYFSYATKYFMDGNKVYHLYSLYAISNLTQFLNVIDNTVTFPTWWSRDNLHRMWCGKVLWGWSWNHNTFSLVKCCTCLMTLLPTKYKIHIFSPLCCVLCRSAGPCFYYLFGMLAWLLWGSIL